MSALAFLGLVVSCVLSALAFYQGRPRLFWASVAAGLCYALTLAILS